MVSRTLLGYLTLVTVLHFTPVIARNFCITPWIQPHSLMIRQASASDDRPANCPPCFNCNLEAFQCQQFGECSAATGRCRCPEGFGGEDCGVPLCGSPALGHDRAQRPADQKNCECPEGWEGVNCNVCTTDLACNAMMPEGKDGICYRNGVVQTQNHQFCQVTNRKIVDMLDPRKPQVTFSCNAEEKVCDFQFWVDGLQSFYCALDTCEWKFQVDTDRNTTTYQCEKAQCRCMPGRTLCGEGGVDLTPFIGHDITGPAVFESITHEKDKSLDTTTFREPHLDGLIAGAFGDDSILLTCGGGECLYKSQVPGYARPVKTVNTSLVAGLISGCALIVVAVAVAVAWLSRRKRFTGSHGATYLEDEDEGKSMLMADHKSMALHFQNVSYSISGKQILSDIQGSVHPGELLAVMGASGAGKTTLLDILARKNKRGAPTGDFYINGEIIPNDRFRDVIGFVDQDDAMLPTLTVHETILDSALLRLPKDMSFAAKQRKVEDVERQLGIYHIRDALIGSAEGHRGISGGEKRRVSIACELVTSPSILFLDEPTSGLDAFNAYNVVECLVKLAKAFDRSIVFTIHQPRSNIVALFDRLLLLANGRTVYSGRFSQCQGYFNSIGFSCPTGFNIADYIVDLTMSGRDDERGEHIVDRNASSPTQRRHSTASLTEQSSAKEALLGDSLREDIPLRSDLNDGNVGLPSNDKDVDNTSWHELSETSQPMLQQRWHDKSNGDGGSVHLEPLQLDLIVEKYRASAVAETVQQDLQQTVASASKPQSSLLLRSRAHHRIGLARQFTILAARMWRNLYRNPMLMLTHYATSTVLAVLLGYLFFGLSDDIAGFQNRMGILSFVLALFGFSTLTTLTVFADERLLFMRERAKGYYHPFAYFAAKVIFDVVPLRLIPPIILSAIVYPMTGLLPAWPQFLIFTLTLVLFNLAAASVCLFIGIVVRNGGTANLIGSLVMLFSLLFSGLFLNHEKIPAAASWLQMLSTFHYAFEALLINEVRHISLVERKYGLDIEVPGASILSSFGFKVQALWPDVTGLAIFASSFILLGYAAMHFLLVEKR